MMNWAGAAFKCAQVDFNLGSDIMNIFGNYLSSKSRQMSLKLKEGNLKRAAKAAIVNAGMVQRNARQQMEMRLVQLGQDKGRISAQAAGSGMDVTHSRTVAKTALDTARSAWNDVRVIGENAQVQAQSHVNDWLSAESERISTRYARIQEGKNRKYGLWGGILTAAANWTGGMIDSGSMLAGGNGNNIGIANYSAGGMGGLMGGG